MVVKMISWADITIVVVFLCVTLWLGLREKTTDNRGEHYILGGRMLSLPAFIATTVSTWYGGILGVGEYAWKYGLSNWFVFGVPYYAGAILFAVLLSRRARQTESLTLPHRIEQLYGKQASVCAGILIFLTTIPGAYMLIMGSLGSYVFGIPLWSGVILSAVFVVAYLWKGGFHAVVKTDAIQIFFMFGSFIFLTIWLIAGYGLSPLETLPESHFSPTGGLPVWSVLVWYIIALSTLTEPNFFQRCFAAKTPKIARNGLLLSVLCWFVFDLMTTLCGLYARALLPDLENPIFAFPALANLVLPAGLVGIFFAGLFATVLSTLDSNLFTTAATIGRDLWPQKNLSENMRLRTQTGLIIGAFGACAIALISGSVIEIWKMFGSVSAASLLIPIFSTYYSRLKMSSKGALILMISSSVVTAACFVMKKFFDFYPDNMEPLFAGGGVSIIVFMGDHIFRRFGRKTACNSENII